MICRFSAAVCHHLSETTKCGAWELCFEANGTTTVFFLEIDLTASLDPLWNFTMSMIKDTNFAPDVLRFLLTVSFLRQGLIPPWPIGRIRDMLNSRH